MATLGGIVSTRTDHPVTKSQNWMRKPPSLSTMASHGPMGAFVLDHRGDEVATALVRIADVLLLGLYPRTEGVPFLMSGKPAWRLIRLGLPTGLSRCSFAAALLLQ